MKNERQRDKKTERQKDRETERQRETKTGEKKMDGSKRREMLTDVTLRH